MPVPSSPSSPSDRFLSARISLSLSLSLSLPLWGPLSPSVARLNPRRTSLARSMLVRSALERNDAAPSRRHAVERALSNNSIRTFLGACLGWGEGEGEGGPESLERG
jgi:hypothetical protein